MKPAGEESKSSILEKGKEPLLVGPLDCVMLLELLKSVEQNRAGGGAQIEHPQDPYGTKIH